VNGPSLFCINSVHQKETALSTLCWSINTKSMIITYCFIYHVYSEFILKSVNPFSKTNMYAYSRGMNWKLCDKPNFYVSTNRNVNILFHRKTKLAGEHFQFNENLIYVVNTFLFPVYRNFILIPIRSNRPSRINTTFIVDISPTSCLYDWNKVGFQLIHDILYLMVYIYWFWFILENFVLCPGQNKGIAPLSFFHGYRKRLLKV
jgi:hypothetical protein